MLAPIRMHLLRFTTAKIQILNIVRCSLSWLIFKYFGKEVWSSLDDSNYVNSLKILFFQLLLDFMNENHAALGSIY